MSNLDSLRMALEQSPDNVPLLLLYAQTCLDEWSVGDARETFERVLKIDGENADAKLGIARALYLDGKMSEAAIRLEQLAEQHPDFGPGFVLLSRIYFAEENTDGAIDAYRKGVAADKNCIDEALAKELGIDPSGADPGAPKRVRLGGGPGWSAAVEDEDDAFGEDFSEDGEGEELFAEMERPKQKFDDVGGMHELKEEIRMKILYPLQNQELFRAYGKSVGGGVLLYGPPGCGKTLISRATAGEIDANFFSVGLHEILDMWIGSSEKNLHQIFKLARDNAPSVLFFDEVDALAADRKDLRQSAGKTVINQFLAEMDSGDNANDGVLILGATNAPWHIDSAFRRPGRFDRTIFVQPPDEDARAAIIEVMAKDKPMGDLDAQALAKKTKHFSGADLKSVFDIAIEAALTEAMKEGRIVPLNTKLLIKTAKAVNPSTRAWFDSAKNYAMYANQSGFYDDVLSFLGIKKG